MSAKSYDVIVIGAGSVGNPAAAFLAMRGLKTLVIESYPSPGQGQNKSAIGGVRATHSDPAKIKTCLRSLEIFSTMKEKHGHDVGWKTGGYCFPVYDEGLEKTLKGLLEIQKEHGLDIDWVDADRIKEVIPGVNENGLRGGTYSPGDGQVSPLMAADAFWKIAVEHGAEYRFNEKVSSIEIKSGKVTGVRTDKGAYAAPNVLNAAGGYAREVGDMAGLNVPVTPDSHEAGISAPVKPFLAPLVVDMRPGPDGRTANFYFGQNHDGRIIFCYTPSELFTGTDRRSQSEFLPIIARRLIALIPAFRNLLIRRVWRGLYPMTPDGSPIVGAVKEIEGMYLGVGMCGQGFMMGPGVAENLASLIAEGKPVMDEETFEELSFYRELSGGKKELLK